VSDNKNITKNEPNDRKENNRKWWLLYAKNHTMNGEVAGTRRVMIFLKREADTIVSHTSVKAIFCACL
jgi:hypothetical protein